MELVGSFKFTSSNIITVPAAYSAVRLTWLSLAYIINTLSLITPKNKNKRKMQYARESKISKKWLVIIVGVIGVVATLGVTFGIRSLVPCEW